jgi:putative tryptophan/tyrosine transport system substrate-binding protein
MTRREFIIVFGGVALWPFAASAQPVDKVVRIGFLRQAAPAPKLFEAFREGLRAAGYVEGRNVLIEQRYAAGAYDRLGELAAEFVRANVGVIVVDGTAAAKACREKTTAIPIVFTLAVDPVGDGLAASFARPGGNLTGLTLTAGDGLAGKRVELLKDMVPSMLRVAVLRNPRNPPNVPYMRETQGAAIALGLDVRSFDVSSPHDLPPAFAAIAEWRADGLVTLSDAMMFSQRERIADLTLKNKLPGLYPEAEFVAAGGLASYGPSLPELFRQAAGYVDKILKGANPAELPLQRPSKFELVINLKVAQALGLTISRDFQLRADEVVE